MAITIILLALLILVLLLIFFNSKQHKHQQAVLGGVSLVDPPSPVALPIIGHLHLLGGYEVPYQAFTALGKKYGDVLKLRLGSVPSVVVNGKDNIKEVLVSKGHHFDSRPSFERYQQLFGGNKQNSLAFCDWSETQRIRRDMLKTYTFPRALTNKFASFEEIVGAETNNLVQRLSVSLSQPTEIKPFILKSCANMFTSHFCSKSFAYTDPSFNKMVENFDEIFYEVNQGYAADFLPFLLPLHQRRLKKMSGYAHEIRDFINDNIIKNRFKDYAGEDPSDYVESLIHHVKGDDWSTISWDSALFALEDIIGGHSAVGNFLIKLLAYIVKEPQVQKKIQEEIDFVAEREGNRPVTISDRSSMPYTEAAIFEAIRLIASPIVPRVSNQDTSINGYRIKKDSLVFLNNYDLSMSDELWRNPGSFDPDRFVSNGHVVKPDYFLPFGGGRRSCMGYKMVQLISFGVLSSILQNFHILPVDRESYRVPVGSLALPKKTFSFRFERRKR